MHLLYCAVKALEEMKSNGTCDENIDTILANAEKRALEKLNNASKAPSRAMPHGQLIGGMAGPHDMKPAAITGSGLVLNALATSRGLSQLVNSVTPSDHSYTSAMSGLPGSSTGQFKPELTTPQPSAMKSSVRSSLVALSSSLRSGGPAPLSLSTSTTGAAQAQTRSSVPFTVGPQGELHTAVYQRLGSCQCTCYSYSVLWCYRGLDNLSRVRKLIPLHVERTLDVFVGVSFQCSD